jgi:quinol-cytochrome oxidoreductase complex cytochrome b subunit
MTRTEFLQRIGWNEHLRPFLYKKLPPNTGWSATLGSLCALLFVLMVATGLILAMYYNPSPDKAFQSVDYIMKDAPFAAMVRGLHHWGASAMVLTVFIHLLCTFFSGAYKAPRELTWMAGACLLLVTLGLGFTGYLLPWDMKAYWATVVSTNIPRELPGIGEAVTRAVLGGDGISGLTLTRFYAIHTMLLPALLLIFAVVHIYLVRLHGMADHGAKAKQDDLPEAPAYRFYPEHTLRSALVFVAVLILLSLLSHFVGVHQEEVAGTLIESYLPRPEWYYMWLFQLLTYFPGSFEAVGSLAVPTLGLVLLFSVPFLGRSGPGGPRPLAIAAGVALTVSIVFLTLAGFEGASTYGEIIPVPAGTLSAQQTRGLFLYADKECAYCHQIGGKGGHRTGPDLANMAAKGRKVPDLAKFIKDPQATASTSVMPKYTLPEADANALGAFVLMLGNDQPKRILKRKDVLSGMSTATGL